MAYYVLYGKIVCQYEPVMTKHFYHGRTEAMRTTTPKAAAFCECWASRSSTDEEKIEALRAAALEHSRLVKEASAGKGIDRHLFALKCVAERNGIPVPPFFQSDAWTTLNHTVLSTSNCGNPALRLFGFGPVVPDGFGIGYIIKDFGLQYSVSSKHRQTKRYAHTLHKILLELQGIMVPHTIVTVKPSRSTAGEFLLPAANIKNTTPIREDLLEYAEGIDYFGELGMERRVLPPMPPRNETLPPAPTFENGVKKQKYLANVHPRSSGFSEDEIRKVGITLSHSSSLNKVN